MNMDQKHNSIERNLKSHFDLNKLIIDKSFSAFGNIEYTFYIMHNILHRKNDNRIYLLFDIMHRKIIAEHIYYLKI